MNRVDEGALPAVPGPCGDILTRRQLPTSFHLRWTARRKAEIVVAVENGILSLEEACARYVISPEEFLAWKSVYAREGMGALRCNAHHRKGAPRKPRAPSGTRH